LSAAYLDQVGVTDTRDFSDAVWYVNIVVKDAATTSVTVKVSWFEDAGTNAAPQSTEAILAGEATGSVYEYVFAITGTGMIPAIPLPVIGVNTQVSVKVNAGTTTTAYVRVWRKS
jgi:hypothetical protein